MAGELHSTGVRTTILFLFASASALGTQADTAARMDKTAKSFADDKWFMGSVLVARGAEVLYSVRIGLHYRALATMENGVLVWFWIGHHSIYDKIVAGR